jgi:hypothetical protein
MNARCAALLVSLLPVAAALPASAQAPPPIVAEDIMVP